MLGVMAAQKQADGTGGWALPLGPKKRVHMGDIRCQGYRGDARVLRGPHHLGAESRDAISLADKVAGRQPTKFAAWARANFAVPAAA